jgi:pseudouridine synthase
MEGKDIDKLKKGVWLAEGKTGAAAVKVLRRSALETTIQISIRKGLNRQIRRTFAQLGFKVKALKRVRIGDIELKGIAIGSYKRLTNAQIAYLKRATDM